MFPKPIASSPWSQQVRLSVLAALLLAMGTTFAVGFYLSPGGEVVMSSWSKVSGWSIACLIVMWGITYSLWLLAYLNFGWGSLARCLLICFPAAFVVWMVPLSIGIWRSWEWSDCARIPIFGLMAPFIIVNWKSMMSLFVRSPRVPAGE